MIRRRLAPWGAARAAAVVTILAACGLPATVLAQHGGDGTGVVAGTVTDATTGEPLQSATVFIVGTQRGSATRSDGRYRFNAAAGPVTLRVRALGYVGITDTVTIVAGQSITHDFRLSRTLTALDQVVVTGTRQPNRTAVEAPVPIDVLTAAEITQSGRTETSQILQLLAPSVNFPRPTVTDGTDHIRPATLRGLNSDQVLVLVNGKRRHNSSLVNINGSVGRGSMAVDLNAIPPSAIDHIEILRDGAAAQYGSDAIAGVINIILKTNAPGMVEGQFGQTKVGDGRTVIMRGDYSVPMARSGYLNLSGEFRKRDSTNRAGPDTRTQFFAGDARNTDPAYVNRLDSWIGDPNQTASTGMFNFGLPITDSVQLYSFGGLSFSHGNAAGFFRRPLDDRTVRAIYPTGFLPLIESHIWDGSLAGGVKGGLAGWSYDLGSVFGRNNFQYNVNHSANVSMGAQSPTSFDAGSTRFSQWTTTLDVQRGFDVGFAQPLSVAFGGELRRDGYGITAGEPASYQAGGVAILDGPNAGKPAAVGAQVFPGFRPSDATDVSRNNVAAYVDLATNPVQSVTIDVAGRAEHYSDFGGTTTGKIAGRWEPVKGYGIRGSVSNGFRAPSLGQEYFSTTSTNFINVNGTSTPFDIRTFPVASAQARALGATPLRPETSRNYGLGVTMEPSSRLSLTADYYHIDIQHRIVLSGNFIGADVAALLQNAGFTGVTGGRFFTNAINTRSEGIDIVAQTGANFGNAGALRFTGSYNHNYTRVTHIDSTPPQLAKYQAVLFDRTQVGLTQAAQPQDNLRLSANYDVNKLGVVLSEARFGSVTSLAVKPTADQTFGARWITDLALSYHVLPRITITAGADNLFNVYPDKVIAVNSTGGVFQYSGISPFGFNGAYYYGRLSIGL